MSLETVPPADMDVTAGPVRRPSPTLARATLLIMAGQILSRTLGFVRDVVIAALFGQSGSTDAFFAAQTVSKGVYDLLVGTTTTAALIPIFSEHADEQDRTELWRIASVVITLVIVLITTLAVLLMLFAPAVMGVTVDFKQASDQQLAVTLARVVMPSLLFLGLAGVLSSLLYSLRSFAYSAFCVAAFNAGIVASALLFHRQLGIAAPAAGLVGGSILMVVIQIRPLMQLRMRFRFSLNLRHPAVRRIGRLYLPVAAGMVVTIAGIIVDRHLASQAGTGVISAMEYATKIVQLPLGIISTALGVAILPTLSRHALNTSLDDYKSVLSRGLKLALALIIPMMIAVLALNNEILGLVYQHGRYTAANRQVASLALYIYAPQLPFVAMDYLLISAFYALKNTLVPAILGAVGVAVYLCVALSLVNRLGMPALVLGNTIQNSLHGAVLFVLLWRRVGGLRSYNFGQSVLKITLAGLAMAAVCLLVSRGLERVISIESFRGQLLVLAATAGLGLGTYAAMAVGLGIDELKMVWQMLAVRLRPARAA